MKIIPENIFIGGSDGDGGLIEKFLGISMIEKLTGKPFNEQSNANCTGKLNATPIEKAEGTNSQEG